MSDITNVARSTKIDIPVPPVIDICSHINEAIVENIKELWHTQTLTMTNLIEYDVTKWLDDRPVELVSMLTSISGLNNYPHNIMLKTKLARIIEHIYASRNQRLILPSSLMDNILIYSCSKSSNIDKSPRTRHCWWFIYIAVQLD